MMISLLKRILLCAVLLLSNVAQADSGISPEVAYLTNTLFLLVCAVLVMFMAAGFAMLEAGMVRSKSVAVILAKNVSLYAISSTMFYLVGYELMYGENILGLIGEFKIWQPAEIAGTDIDITTGVPSSATWFFQMVFVATAASIVSGALAERIKFWPFAGFVVLLSGFIYPIVGLWTWGNGWLSQLGFLDFAGSSIVHSVGGWAALAGALILGSRKGRFDKNGQPKLLAPSSLPMATLGTFILWLGWFGFNGGSQLAFSSIDDALSVATIFVNTNAAAASGVITVIVASQLIFKRLDLTLMLNGALAGLVSITAGPVAPSIGQAALIGAIGGLLMMANTNLLEKLKIDDVVGAIPVHLVAGIWGTLAVCFTESQASFLTQLIGVMVIGAFTFISSFILWSLLQRIAGIRLQPHHEDEGADMSEIGMRAYNI
jgi:Amt family ammonium transporter